MMWARPLAFPIPRWLRAVGRWWNRTDRDHRYPQGWRS